MQYKYLNYNTGSCALQQYKYLNYNTGCCALQQYKYLRQNIVHFVGDCFQMVVHSAWNKQRISLIWSTDGMTMTRRR